MAGLKIPSINAVLRFVVLFLVTAFIIRMAPIPENIKSLFRI